ncbi:MAG: hypothetical protein JO096_00835 [Alphaproteobacteria bacterium]|nr:hypothetical protein [Alphaproteobacteria bacterium]
MIVDSQAESFAACYIEAPTSRSILWLLVVEGLRLGREDDGVERAWLFQ